MLTWIYARSNHKIELVVLFGILVILLIENLPWTQFTLPALSVWVFVETIVLALRRRYKLAATWITSAIIFFVAYNTVLSPRIYYCEGLSPIAQDAMIPVQDMKDNEKIFAQSNHLTGVSLSYFRQLDCKQKTNDIAAVLRMIRGDYHYTYQRL